MKQKIHQAKKSFLIWLANLLGITLYLHPFGEVEQFIIDRINLEKFVVERDFNLRDIAEMRILPNEIEGFLLNKFSKEMVKGIEELITKNPQLLEKFQDTYRNDYRMLQTWRFEMYLNIDKKPPMPRGFKEPNPQEYSDVFNHIMQSPYSHRA